MADCYEVTVVYSHHQDLKDCALYSHFITYCSPLKMSDAVCIMKSPSMVLIRVFIITNEINLQDDWSHSKEKLYINKGIL